MAKQGLLQKKIKNCQVPVCEHTSMANLPKHPGEPKDNNPISKTVMKGQAVSVDQLESSTLGFIAQLKGVLTTKCYCRSFLKIAICSSAEDTVK